MIQGFFEWVRSLILLSFIITLIRVLLPDNSLRPYVRIVLGFVLLAALVKPMVGIIERPRSWETLFWGTLEQSAVVPADRWIQLGRQVEERSLAVALNQLTDRLKHQIEAMIALLPDVDHVKVTSLIVGDVGVERIALQLRGSADPGDGRVKEMLYKYFGIHDSVVQTRWNVEEGE